MLLRSVGSKILEALLVSSDPPGEQSCSRLCLSSWLRSLFRRVDHSVYLHHAAYGAISSEEDSSGGDDSMLAGVDPFLNPVLDPFVAVRCHSGLARLLNSRPGQCNSSLPLQPLGLNMCECCVQGLSEPFQEQYSKLQRNVILTMVVRPRFLCTCLLVQSCSSLSAC